MQFIELGAEIEILHHTVMNGNRHFTANSLSKKAGISTHTLKK